MIKKLIFLTFILLTQSAIIGTASTSFAQAPQQGQPTEAKPFHIYSAAPTVFPSRVVPVACSLGSSCYGISGQVTVDVTINSEGIPIVVKAVSGDPRLMAAVESAVKQYRFKFTTVQSNRGETKMRFDVIVPSSAK